MGNVVSILFKTCPLKVDGYFNWQKIT